MDAPEPPLARQISLYAVIQAILTHGPTSRTDLARRTGLSRQTISEVVYELETAGWLTQGRTGFDVGALGQAAVLVRPFAAEDQRIAARSTWIGSSSSCNCIFNCK